MFRSTPERRGVILDSLPLWLEAIEVTLRRLSVQVVHKATDWADALNAVETHQPELLVAGIDWEDPQEALSAIETAVARRPAMKVIVLSSKADKGTIETVLARGASAFVMKSAHPDDLASVVRQVFDRSVYYARLRNTPSREPGNSNPPPSRSGETFAASRDLTRREIEVLRFVAQGRSNAELAKELWVTEQTVKFHLSNIYRKLGVRNRTEASLWAQRQRLLGQRANSSAA